MMAWNDERVELLKKLWSEGLSASQIAGRLGGVTGTPSSERCIAWASRAGQPRLA